MSNKSVSPISLLPFYHQEEYLSTHNEKNLNSLSFFLDHFNKDFAIVTLNGRHAISLILENLNLKRSDEVFIVTTFDYPNVSSCVTSTIFNYCKPARVMTENTRAVLVIHEFGVPYQNLELLKATCIERRIPLIEDCAHTIDSVLGNKQVGTLGDWVICSLPKIFPVLSGGILLGKKVDYNPAEHELTRIATIQSQIEPMLNELADSSTRRREVYRQLTEITVNYNLYPVYMVTEKITPWFFPLNVPDIQKTMDKAAEEGIECALWHGTNIVVFPCHQYINADHIERIESVIKYISGGK